MLNMLRRHLLVSTAAVFSLTLAPALVSALSAPLGASIVSVALADDDNDGGSDDGGNDDNDGGSDDNGGDDDNGGNDDGGNDNGSDDNGSDDSGDDDDGTDDDSSDDNGVDDNGADDDLDNGANSNRGRDDRTSLVVNDRQLRGLKNGTMVAVDQNGRRLALEIEQEHNRTEVKIKAPRNSVTAVTIVPAN
ncbi:MAG: hypothetical protein H5U22_08285 [Rhizobium sp.]|nr:hypothetical protein [Rhizobium sp.]